MPSSLASPLWPWPNSPSRAVSKPSWLVQLWREAVDTPPSNSLHATPTISTPTTPNARAHAHPYSSILALLLSFTHRHPLPSPLLPRPLLSICIKWREAPPPEAPCHHRESTRFLVLLQTPARHIELLHTVVSDLLSQLYSVLVPRITHPPIYSAYISQLTPATFSNSLSSTSPLLEQTCVQLVRRILVHFTLNPCYIIRHEAACYSYPLYTSKPVAICHYERCRGCSASTPYSQTLQP